MPPPQDFDTSVADLSQVTLAVLAGGNGARMGSPKSHLRFEERPILEWFLRHIEWPGPTLLITAPGVAHPPGADLFDREVSDPVSGLGPLRGVLTALEHSLTPIVAIVTIDMPAVNTSMLAWIVAALGANSETKGVMCGVTNADGRHIEPFPSAFRSEARQDISERIRANDNSVQALAALPGFLALGAPTEWPADVWTNLNTPAEFAAFKAVRESLSARKSA